MVLSLSKKNISSKKLRFEELADRVIRACEEMGIHGVILKEWKPNPLENESTFGVARERKDDDTASSLQIGQDIGYLRRPDYSTLTFESFYINPRVFSRSAYDRFQAALEKQGLFPGCYAAHPLGPRFYTEREIKESLNPTPKYI